MLAATASITHDDAYEAGRDLAAELIDGLGASPDVVLLFAAPRYEPRAVLAGLHRRLKPTVKLLGCSSFAEIDRAQALSGSVTALGLRGDELDAHVLCATSECGDDLALGRALGEQALARGAALLLLFLDGVALDGPAVLRGAQSVLGADFPIAGGVAADDARFVRTYQFCGHNVHSRAAVGLALTGPARLVSAARSAWEPLGATRRCTRVEDRRLVLELDGKPALNLYRDYLGIHGRDLRTAGIEFPLGVVGLPDRPRTSDDVVHVVRAVHRVDEQRGGLCLSGDIPEGAEVRMLRATKQDLIRGAAEATAEVAEKLPTARFALMLGCFARKTVLGARYKEEVAAAHAMLPVDLPRAGFYGYGALAAVGGRPIHHDTTFAAAVLEV